MILARIEQYMRDHRRSALTDMAISLDAAPDALRNMLGILERKGGGPMGDQDDTIHAPYTTIMRKVMGREDILVSDVGAHKMWIARHYDCYEPNTCLISNGFASMGFSIPGAFAAKILNPDKKVLAVREKAPVRPKRMDAF